MRQYPLHTMRISFSPFPNRRCRVRLSKSLGILGLNKTLLLWNSFYPVNVNSRIDGLQNREILFEITNTE